ncbi:LacI family DNA-binding transcriptional regulator [Novosphingobium clariflavum]|uniref:LacI family DNA-binding transcriptional regulator n=1 Tax=Novosphingobium clariflavum TaxID=2029884 RepID=A0ABV6SBL3_9SPHN|nr:LacI family DNA-binding transcriptional regulator [Novosphingobium clariflavum]
MASIRDVAAAAGVSIKTVSRVVNKAPNVSEDLRSRVTGAIERLGYRPNQSARRLAGGRSFMLAFLYNNPTPGYTSALQVGAANRCRELGYHLVVEPMPLDGPERFEILDRLVAALRPDGVFLAPPLSDDKALLQHLSELNLSCARLAGSIMAQSFNIPTPERAAGRMIADHLIELGHRRIGVITPPAGHRAAQARVEGFRDGLSAASGLAIDPMFVAGDFDFASGEQAAGQLLAQDPPPTAIFATNDAMALGVMTCAHRRGLKVPADLSIVGFDDTSASATTWPPLTTVRQPLEEMGRALVDALVGDVDEAPEFRFELVRRESTGPAPRR